jgi:predicted PilT family ATPase
VQIPKSVRAQVIGKGGATIKAIQEKTGARIHMPKNDDTNAGADDDDDAMVEVKIEGNALAAEMARAEIQKFADERTSTVSHKLRDIPAEFYPFIAGANNSTISRLEDGKDLRINVPTYHTWTQQAPPQAPAPGQTPDFLPATAGNHITLAGDRLAVQEARAEIERQVQELREQLVLEQLAIDKGRQQFIMGERGVPVHEFFAETGCAVILPGDSDDEMVTIIGPQSQIAAGMEKAMDLAVSRQLTNIDIARQHQNAPGGAAQHARNLTRYLQQRREIQRLEKAYDSHIVTPVLRGGPVPWELYSRDGKNAIRARSEITNIVNGHPPSRMANVDVDPFFHQHLRSVASPKLREDYGVLLIIPNESERASPVLLVFEGPEGASPDYQVPRTQPTPAEVQAFQQGLEDARKHILSLISQQAQLGEKDLEVPLKFHDKLRKFVKSEQQKLPAGEIPVRITAAGTKVSLRGPAVAVEALGEKMAAWVEQEKEDEKERGFTMSFEFPQKHANQLIGKQGARVKELREKFDVDIQVDDGKVVLKGPKAKAEAAKAHITSLGKAWADEVNYVLKVEPKYHRELIGAQGNQIKKLESRYTVDIYFPRNAKPTKDDQSVADDASEAGRKPARQQAEDEVIVRGPKKGADEARDEILSLLQYLKDNSNTATVTVQQSQIPSLIGQRGAEMDALRQTTGARIDVPNARDAKDPSGTVEIQIRGTKTQVAQAKKLIEEKKAIFDQTVTKTIDIDRKHHSALIGQGGKFEHII